MTTNFTTRYKKDLSTETLKTKVVRRKSLLQKESRHKEFNKGRQFGPIDVNTQASRDKELSRLDETGEEHSPKTRAQLNQIPNASAKTRGQERLEMLQRYKAEKELRKLKEQREKPVFKCGRFKPEAPACFPKTSQIPVLIKPKETAVKTAKMEAPPVRITRSKAKNQLQEPLKPQHSVKAPSYTSKGYISQIPQQKQKQIYVDKLPRKENKEIPSVVAATSNGRIKRAAAAVAKSKIPQASRPVTGNLAQKKETSKGKLQRGVKKEEATALDEMKENTFVDPVKEEETLQPPVSAGETVQDDSSHEEENPPASHIPASVPPRRTRSFAPQNFVFKPLEGLATYKVTPMSPSRADVFLSPNLSWSPANNTSKVPEKDAKETGPKESGPKDKFFPSPDMTEDNTQKHQSTLELPTIETESVPEEVMEVAPCEGETTLQPADLCTVQMTGPGGEAQHDVPYFRNILRSETERLSSECLQWDRTTEIDIPEDAKDLVRTAIGQTRLLIAERFKQFEGLVDNCEFQTGAKETTCTDLDGFWDMVNFQIEDVNKKFENLKKLQGNGWQVVDDVQAKKPCKKKTTLPRANKAGDGAAERAAARKRLAAIKAIMKSKIKQEEDSASSSSMEGEKVVFDGGFFQVESPAKPFPGWTPKSASRTPWQISRRPTPRSAAKALLQCCADTCVLRHCTPTTSKDVLHLPDRDVCMDPSGVDLLGSISEQSDRQAAEEPCITAEGVAEEAPDAQLALCDKGSPSGDQKGLVTASLEGPENPSVQTEVPVTAEEAGQSDADVNKQDILCSPKRDSQSENKPLHTGEQHTPEGPLLGDFSCELSNGNGTPDCQADLEASLFFTPLRNKAEQLGTAATCDNLIVFSPVALPEEGK